MMTALVDGAVQHKRNGQPYKVLGFVSAPMKHRKDGDINFLTISFLDEQDRMKSRRTVHLLDSRWVDDRVAIRMEVILQISKAYRPDETLVWVLYESPTTLVMFARPRPEFEDGRFIQVQR